VKCVPLIFAAFDRPQVQPSGATFGVVFTAADMRWRVTSMGTSDRLTPHHSQR
jgi:hypothetical protein